MKVTKFIHLFSFVSAEVFNKLDISRQIGTTARPMKAIILPLTLLFPLLISCSKGESLQKSNSNRLTDVQALIFGDHDRNSPVSEQDMKKTPYRYIGRLIGTDGRVCTASLVGEKMILTAAHCIADPDGTINKGNFYFELGRSKTIAVAGSLTKYAKYGNLGPYVTLDRRQNDWALLSLQEPLGANHGYFKVADPEQIKRNNNIYELDMTIAGYGVKFSGGHYMTQHRGCRFRNALGDLYRHDCDTWGGDSGAAMCSLQAFYIR